MKGNLRLSLTLQLFADEKPSGTDIAALLRRIDTLHSLRAAAMAMDIPYSRAWNAVKQAEGRLGFPLVRSSTGGRHGGGAALTEEAEALLAAYDACCAALQKAAEGLYREHLSQY